MPFQYSPDPTEAGQASPARPGKMPGTGLPKSLARTPKYRRSTVRRGPAYTPNTAIQGSVGGAPAAPRIPAPAGPGDPTSEPGTRRAPRARQYRDARRPT
ncbi:hypothetical protein GCM10010289_73210 [Streptomyces violascens]|nr:hypothetical protein GCM10010289_73210 [Streptomyces violascens]